MYLPTALGIAHGQDCVLVLAIVLGVYALANRRRNFLSGVILGAGLIKFHLFLLWPVMLLIQRRWRMLAGASAAVAVEGLVSLALAGPSGIAKYVALLRMTDLRHLSPSPELMINVRGLALNVGLVKPGIDRIVVTGLLTALAVILTAAACWRAPLWRAVAAASAGSLLVAPHVYGYDAGLLLAGLWLAMFEGGNKATLSPDDSHDFIHAGSDAAWPGGIALGRRNASGSARVSHQSGLDESNRQIDRGAR